MSWWQGVENLEDKYPLQTLCMKKWIMLNPNYEIKIITKKNYKKYLPEFSKIINLNWKIPIQKQINLLRLNLLKEYGGTWVDATLYPQETLNNIQEQNLNEMGIFMFRLPNAFFSQNDKNDLPAKRLYSNWFIDVSTRNHYLISSWFNEMKKITERPRQWEKYFIMHEVLQDLCFNNHQIKFTIDNMKQVHYFNILNKYQNVIKKPQFNQVQIEKELQNLKDIELTAVT